MIVVAVADREEEVHKVTIFVVHGEIALMVFHRRNDGSFRELEEFFIEFAAQGCRIFDEEDDFFQEVFVHHDSAAFFVS